MDGFEPPPTLTHLNPTHLLIALVVVLIIIGALVLHKLDQVQTLLVGIHNEINEVVHELDGTNARIRFRSDDDT